MDTKETSIGENLAQQKYEGHWHIKDTTIYTLLWNNRTKTIKHIISPHMMRGNKYILPHI